MITKAHFKIVFGKLLVYLSIIPKILVGIYLPIKALTSGNPILFLINVKILKVKSTIAIKNTKDENLLKNITTTNINTIKITASIYTLPTPIFYTIILIHIVKKNKSLKNEKRDYSISSNIVVKNIPYPLEVSFTIT